MVKRTVILFLITVLFSLSACSKSTADNASPEALYKQDKSIDFLVYGDIAYVNASEIDWIMELTLTQSEKLGEIKRTDIKKRFKDFDATVLGVGTEIYSVTDRDDIVLVSTDGGLTPYYAYREG